MNEVGGIFLIVIGLGLLFSALLLKKELFFALL